MEIEVALQKYCLQLRADGRSAQHTVAQYARHVGALAAWLESNGHTRDVGEIDHELLARFLVSDQVMVRADGRPKRATSVNAMRSSLRTFFGYVHAVGWSKRNAARLTRRARTGTAPPKSLSEQDQARLLEVLAKAEGRAARRDHALVHLMLASGLRIGSALALQVEDLDLERGEIEVRVSKGDRPSRVFASAVLVQHLRAYVEEVGDGFLFPGAAGAALTQRQAARRLEEWARTAGIKRHVNPHMLRHSFGARIYGKTGDLLLTQQAMMHRAIVSTTMYARCSEARLRKAVGS